jgi:micrococcal nuclease
MKPALFPIILLCLCCYAVAAESASVIRGKVTAVTDGDTLKIGAHVIRLAEIDAPEKGQQGGLNARQFLEAQVLGKRVTVEVSGIDRYGRYIGYVRKGKQDINSFLVEAGWAWRYDEYSKSEELKKLQENAKERKAGIWSAEKPPIKPSDWRKGKR